MKQKISLNVKPNIPEGAIYLGSTMKNIARGASLTIYDDPQDPSGWNEGQPRFLRDFERRAKESEISPMNRMIMPALWMLAHAYLDNDKAKELLDSTLISTSTARYVPKKKDVVYICHSLKANPKFDNYLLDKKTIPQVENYGITIPITGPYPKDSQEELSLAQFVNEFPNVAKAIFLMNESQLERMLKRIPLSESPKEIVTFGDDASKRGISPLLFGGWNSGDYKLFGVTGMQMIPLCSYPVSIGKKNEIEVVFEPEQFLGVSKAYRSARRYSTSENLRKLGELLRLE